MLEWLNSRAEATQPSHMLMSEKGLMLYGARCASVRLLTRNVYVYVYVMMCIALGLGEANREISQRTHARPAAFSYFAKEVEQGTVDVECPSQTRGLR